MVMPEMFKRASASFTSSTLFGRMMVLINFIAALQGALQAGGQRQVLGIGQLGAALGEVKHVNGFVPFGGDEHQVDVAAVLRDDAAHAIQQAQRIVGGDVEDAVSL